MANQAESAPVRGLLLIGIAVLLGALFLSKGFDNGGVNIDTSGLPSTDTTVPSGVGSGTSDTTSDIIEGSGGSDTTAVPPASLLVYVAALFFSLFVHQPNLRRMDALVNELAAMGPPPGAGGEGPPPGAGGPPPQVVELEQRGKAAARNGGILHLGFAVILFLMIFGARGFWVA